MESRRRLHVHGERKDHAKSRCAPPVCVVADILEAAASDAVAAHKKILYPEQRVEQEPGNLQTLLAGNERNVIDADDPGVERLVAKRLRVDDHGGGPVEKDRPCKGTLVMLCPAVERRPCDDQLAQARASDGREEARRDRKSV